MAISIERSAEQRRNRVPRTLMRTVAAGGVLAIAAVLAQQAAGIASADAPAAESVGWYGYDWPNLARPLYETPPPVYGPPVYTPPQVYAPPPAYTAPQILVLPRSGSAGGGSSAGSSTGS
ncbi:hypothetical protein ACFVUS_29860 [Nocardia sp. NPDC058058]|uniref:hypothetical protein n=1 Tax=Nocardia sp. NPDC058058 TaxID=3346317 RepID=UPI0036DDBA80